MNEWGLEMAQRATAAAALPKGLDSQHLQDGTQLSITSVPGDPRLPSSLSRHTFKKKKNE